MKILGIALALVLFSNNAASKTILLVGDSFPHQGYARYVTTPGSEVNTACPYFTDATASGNNMGSSKRLAACINLILSNTHYDVVVFNSGMHDVYVWGCSKGETAHEVELSDHQNNIQIVIDAIIAHGSTPVFVTTTPVENRIACHSNDDIIRYNHADVLTMNSQGIQVIDAYSYMRPVQARYHLPNNIHFTQAGYAYMAKLIMDSISN